MQVLVVLTIINMLLSIVLLFAKKQKRMTYTENMVARTIGAYIIAFLLLCILCLAWLQQYHLIQAVLLVINLILIIILARLVVLLISNYLRSNIPRKPHG